MIEFWQKERTIYPSIFRVLIGLVFLLDLIFTFSAGSFQFDSEFAAYPMSGNTIDLIRENYVPLFIFYGIILILFILGIGKNFTSILVYISQFSLLWLLPYNVSWGDIIMKFTLLYFVFVDSFKFYSIQTSKLNPNSLKSYISKLAVWCIILNLFLVYLSNGFYKSLDVSWQNGSAVFYSFSQFSGFESSLFYSIISHETFSKILSYIIVGQQLTFIPLILWKKTRYFAMIFGIGIHIIMFYQFGLWKFETIMILLYGFLLNDEEWRRIIPKNLRNKFLQSS